MLNDDPTQTGLGLGPSTDDRPATARSKAWGALPLALAPLIAGTCWVVAASLSPWLVPPYLLLMAWFLVPSAGRRPDARAEGKSAGSTVDASTSSSGRDGPADEPGWTSDDPASGASSASVGASGGDPGTAAIASTTSAKGRRGKGRSRKPKPAAGVPEATWIEVGPGKFVRAEASARAAEAGPHDPVVDRLEAADLTPNTPSDDEPAWPGADEAEGSGEVLRGTSPGPGAEADLGHWSIAAPSPEGLGPEPSTEPGASPDVAPPAPDEGPSTADGIMPQVAGPFAVEDRADPDVAPGADDARDRADRAPLASECDPLAETDPAGFPEVAGPSPLDIEGAVPAVPESLGGAEGGASLPGPSAADPLKDERDSGAEAVVDAAGAPQGRGQAEGIRRVATVEEDPPSEPGAPETPGRTEVAPEPADAPRWDAEGGSDSPEDLASETPRDENEPNPAPILERIEPADDADFDRSAAPPLGGDHPVASDGPSWWPRPRSMAHRTRPGLRRRATPAATPPRHLGRSRPAARPPADPRRPSRRGLGRPRQGSRTFPPRSPPRGGRHRGG